MNYFCLKPLCYCIKSETALKKMKQDDWLLWHVFATSESELWIAEVRCPKVLPSQGCFYFLSFPMNNSKYMYIINVWFSYYWLTNSLCVDELDSCQVVYWIGQYIGLCYCYSFAGEIGRFWAHRLLVKLDKESPIKCTKYNQDRFNSFSWKRDWKWWSTILYGTFLFFVSVL